MGNNCVNCTCCKDHLRAKQSEDFEVKKTESPDKYPSPINCSHRTLSLSNESCEKSNIEVQEEISSIDFESSGLEMSPNPERVSGSEKFKTIRQTISLNTINEITDSEINEFLTSNIMIDTEDISKINLTIPANASLDYTLRNYSPGVNESIYRGESDAEGRPHGRGIKVDKQGKYIGYFFEGKPHGMGRLISNTGDIYQGEFRKGKLHGSAVYISSDGTRYEGTFKKGKLMGTGKELWPNGTEYEGEYRKNLRHGKGKLKLTDGSIYIGDFISHKAEGKGKIIWGDSSVYDGEWKDDKMHGYGVFQWADGKVFEGRFLNSLANGYGRLTLQDNQVVEGEWKQCENGDMIYYNESLGRQIHIKAAEMNSFELFKSKMQIR
ncbi:hypothetical protein SteCoe_26671 [Stentor coeruleus]|uniref:MORN repeat protein n=1 Tax=Stentor coeruleus TaxID=5963 RepID=A0A1R2BCB6_9CILI|nr:hypothetical protein SteCoe_26671 [Stentor coeruleus]